MGGQREPWLPWRMAMEHALYGPDGFYRGERPAAHFRTSVHTSPLFAAAVARLALEVDAAVADTGGVDVVDLGCGRGELLTALAELLPARFRLIGVDIVGRPAELPARVDWRSTMPDRVHGLLFANEWLDNVPLDVVEVDEAGRQRLVLVHQFTGEERLGAEVGGADASWLAAHWPLDDAPRGSRAELGRPRDDAWADASSRLQVGLAVAVDYHHRRDSRPPLGTLTGFRAGREVVPVPDGSCDLTAHVALDAAAAAAESRAYAGRPARTGPVPRDAWEVTTSLRSQREVLRALGIRADLPPREVAAADPAGYLRMLSTSSEAAALTASNGLGGFGWLAHARGIALPSCFGS